MTGFFRRSARDLTDHARPLAAVWAAPFLLNVGVIVKVFGTGDKFRLVGFLRPIGIFNLNDDFRSKAGYIALVS